MTIESAGTARQLCVAAEEALTEAAFRTGEFTEVERLFGEARMLAGQDGDREAEAVALSGLGMARHNRNIVRLVAGLAPADADVAAEEDLLRRALAIWQETGDAAGTALALFGVGLVFQVLRRDWAAAMPYFWRAYGLAEGWKRAATCTRARRSTGMWASITCMRRSGRSKRCGSSGTPSLSANGWATRGGSRVPWLRSVRPRRPCAPVHRIKIYRHLSEYCALARIDGRCQGSRKASTTHH